MNNSVKQTQEYKDKIVADKKYLIRYATAFGCMYILTVVGIIVYYELRITIAIADVYISSQNASLYVIRSFFNSGIDLKKAAMFGRIAEGAGYTENAFRYMISVDNRPGFYGVLILVLAITAVLLIKLCVTGIRRETYIYFSDIAEINDKLNDRISREVEFVNKRNEELNRFIENIAHQVKTPLAALRLNIEMGVNGSENIMHIDRINEFIKRLLNISRLENKKIAMLNDRLNIYELLNSARDAFAESERQNINIKCGPVSRFSTK